MARLFERLFPASHSDTNIAIHLFKAALADYADGESTTRAQMVAFWELDAEAQADLDVLLTTIDGATAQGKLLFLHRLDAVLVMAECGVKYTTQAEFATRLGLT